MNRLLILVNRLLSLFGKRRLDEELDVELRAHLDALTEANMRRGMSPEEARFAARREFGGLEQTKALYREQRGLPFLETLVQDLRFAVRMLRKSPGFTAVAVLTLGLGIGANTVIFSVVDAVLLRALPYPEPDRIVRIWESSLKRDVPRNLVNPLNFLDWRDHSQSFESMAAVSSLMTTLTSHGQPIAVQGMQVTPEFFSVLRVAPFLGRTFNAADGIPGQDHGVILTYELWQRQFGANRAIVGQKIDVNGGPGEVIGGMHKGFSFPGIKAEVWTPLALARPEWREGGRFLSVAARLKPGVSISQARQDMLRVAGFTARARPDNNKDWSANVFPMLEDATQGVRRPLWVLLASVGFLLLIACANVANLLLMRGTGRMREMAVPAALGAGRSRIIQQLFVESLLLSLTGKAVGLVFAHGGLRNLLALIPQTAPLPRSEPIAIDERVLLFTFLASLSTAVLFGLVPALRLSRVDLQNALKQGTLRGGVGGHQSLRRFFVVAEVSLAFLLSVGAGLMLRSFARLISVDPGFNREHLLTMHIWTSPARYHDDVKRSFAERFFPRQDILGKQLRVCWTIEKPVEIVGVVADARQAHLQDAPVPTIFLSNSQAPMYFATFVVRASGDPRQIARSVEAAVRRVDPDQAVSDIQTMETIFSDSVSSPRFQAVLLLVFASLAVALAMIGVYGVVSYSVSQRTNEIGIRVAMGARSSEIVRLVLREALALSGIALGFGLAGSLALSRVLQTLLFEVTPTDPVTLASVCCLVLVVSALAAVWPARRAMRVDPMVALRYE